MSSLRVLSSRGMSALLIALGVSFASTSCENIIGIEDRVLGPCSHYCDVVMHNCSGTNLVYENRQKCMGVCQHFDVGKTDETQGQNTLECRLHQAELAAMATDDPEHPGMVKEGLCRSAGPEGFGTCGSSCESYCTLYERICGGVQCGSHQKCVEQCGGLRNNTMRYDVEADHDGNSLQCRFVHLSNASITPGGQPHCGHANLSHPSAFCTDIPIDENYGQGYAGAASGSPSEPPSEPTGPDKVKPEHPQCSDYCQVTMTACGTNEYESPAQCNALCQYFTDDLLGEFEDTNQNTLGCRLYHAFNSQCAADEHCPHAGPGGEGHCGTDLTDKCASYCQLAQRVCGTQYTSAFPDGDADCMSDCAKLPDAVRVDYQPGDMLPVEGTRYTTTYALTPGTLACRLLAVSRAALDPSVCPSAFGDCSLPPPATH